MRKVTQQSTKSEYRSTRRERDGEKFLAAMPVPAVRPAVRAGVR